ncbi:MAG: M23 family metallopeptidase [Candidatus Binataceae bacterium]
MNSQQLGRTKAILTGVRRLCSIAVSLSLILLALIADGFCRGADAGTKTAATQTLTPMLLSIRNAPVSFAGSDGHTHLVYELWMTNFSSGNAAVEQVQIFGDNRLLATLDKAAVAQRLQPAGLRVSSATMAPSSVALLFVHVVLPKGGATPNQLSHQVEARFDAAPPGHQDWTATLGGTRVDRRRVAVIGPPLRGEHYISADSCCDATRHTRAALPVDGAVWVAQRYAVDWEQLDAHNRICSGPTNLVKNYTIYGRPVLAVADGTVVTAINDQPDVPPGSFPAGLTVDQADGNAVILDLGGGNYAMYAHMQPGSVRVAAGDRVTRGEVLGLVGNSGNTLAPHLHFQLMDSPHSLESNGLPYEIDHYQITGATPGTEAFDHAEANGTPLALTGFMPPHQVTSALPLDQQIISFH